MQNKLLRSEKSVNKGIFVILVLALGLRLISIDQSFWLDEAAQAIESSRAFGEQLNIPADFQPPLYHLWVHLFSYFGRSEVWLRMASVIPGLISIYLTFLVGAKLWSERVGLTAALLVATSNFHIFYSQELRPYMLATMFGVYSFYYLWLWLESGQKGRLGYILASIGGMYSMYLYGFYWLGQLVLVGVFHKKQLKKFVMASGWVGLAFLPWLGKLIEQLKGGIGLITLLPGWSQAVSTIWYKAAPLVVIKFLVGRVEVDLVWWQVMLWGGLILTLLWLGLKVAKRDLILRKVGLMMVVSLSAAFIMNLVLPVLEPKRLLTLLPLFYLLIAVVADRKTNKWLLILILGISMMSNVAYWLKPKLQREQWRQAVEYIETRAGNDDAVVFAFPQPFAPWQWYETDKVDEISFGTFVTNESQVYDVLNQSRNNDKFFVFEYLMDLTDPDRMIFVWFGENGFVESDAVNFEGVGIIRVFESSEVLANADPVF